MTPDHPKNLEHRLKTHNLNLAVTMTHDEAQSSFQHLLDMNRRGVQSMQSGNNLEAISRFRSGLEMLLDTMCRIRSDDENPSRSCDEGDVVGIPISPIHSVGLSSSSASGEVYDDVFELFDRAFVVSSPSSWQDEWSKQLAVVCQTMAAILSFNVGLAYHLIGLKCGHSRYLFMALKFYHMAQASVQSPIITQQQSAGFPNSAPSIPTYHTLILLALINNRGNIFTFFRRFLDVAYCGEEIVSLLAPMSSYSMDPEFRCFFLNAIFFNESRLNCSPAA